MSYCVHCGVKLAASERVCPLCDTEVQDPKQPYDAHAPKPFPPRLDLLTPEDNRGFAAAILSLVLALPAAICLACDVAYTRGAGWSVLVIGAMAMLWIFAVPAMLLRRHRVLICTVLDTGAMLGYLFILERFFAPGKWFTALALPLVIALIILFMMNYWLMQTVVRGRFRQAALAVGTVPVFLLCLEGLIDRFIAGHIQLLWSYFVAIPCVLLMVLLLLVDRRTRLKAQIKKRLHM